MEHPEWRDSVFGIYGTLGGKGAAHQNDERSLSYDCRIFEESLFPRSENFNRRDRMQAQE